MIRTIIYLFFLYFVILCKGKKTIISYVLARQTQQPKTVKKLHLHTATSVLYKNKLLCVASRALRLSEKY